MAGSTGFPGGKSLDELADMHEAGTLGVYLDVHGVKGVERTNMHRKARQRLGVRQKSGGITPKAALRGFDPSAPLSVGVISPTSQRPEYRVVPAGTVAGAPNQDFDTEAYIQRAFQHRTATIVGPTASGGVEKRTFTRGARAKNMTDVATEVVQGATKDPPYTPVEERTQRRAPKAPSSGPSEPDITRLSPTAQQVINLSRAVGSFGQFRKRWERFVVGNPMSRRKGGDLETIADMASEYWSQTIGDSTDTMPAGVSDQDYNAMAAGGFIGTNIHKAREAAKYIPLATTAQVYDYNPKFDPKVVRADHVKGWATALTTGDTSELDRTSALLNRRPRLESSDLPEIEGLPDVNAAGLVANVDNITDKELRGDILMHKFKRLDAAKTTGETASISHPEHQDLTTDLDGVPKEGNFLYRIASQHGVDPNEGHAETIMQNADRVIREAGGSVHERLLAVPQRRVKYRKGANRMGKARRVPVTTARWMQLAEENIANKAERIAARTKPVKRKAGEKAPVMDVTKEAHLPIDTLPALHAGQAEPTADHIPDPVSRAAMQNEIDIWKNQQQVAAATRTGDITYATPGQSITESAPYLRGMNYTPFVNDETTGVLDEEHEVHDRAFRAHRESLLDMYRKSPAAATLFTNGAAGQSEANALISAKHATEARNQRNQEANQG